MPFSPVGCHKHFRCYQTLQCGAKRSRSSVQKLRDCVVACINELSTRKLRTHHCITGECAPRQPVRRSQNASSPSALVLRLRPLIFLGRRRCEERQACTCSEAFAMRLPKTGPERITRHAVERSVTRVGTTRTMLEPKSRAGPCISRAAECKRTTEGHVQYIRGSVRHDGKAAPRLWGQMSTTASGTRASSRLGDPRRPAKQRPLSAPLPWNFRSESAA